MTIGNAEIQNQSRTEGHAALPSRSASPTPLDIYGTLVLSPGFFCTYEEINTFICICIFLSHTKGSTPHMLFVCLYFFSFFPRLNIARNLFSWSRSPHEAPHRAAAAVPMLIVTNNKQVCSHASLHCWRCSFRANFQKWGPRSEGKDVGSLTGYELRPITR